MNTTYKQQLVKLATKLSIIGLEVEKKRNRLKTLNKKTSKRKTEVRLEVFLNVREELPWLLPAKISWKRFLPIRKCSVSTRLAANML